MSKQAEVMMLTTGVKALIRPVPSYLIDQMVGQIRDPKPPKQFIEEKGREEENPLDPAYLDALNEANRQRGLHTMKAMIAYGIELVDGVPDVDEWLPKLQWMEKHTNLDLQEYDLEDPLDLEFVYKAFVAVSGVDLMMVTIKSGMQNEEVASAMEGFRSISEPSTDPAGDSKVQG